MKLRAVWQPLGYLFLYNMMQVPNAAWMNFLVKGLKFSEFDLGLLSISSAIMTMVGLSMYKIWCFHTSFRSIYVITTVLGSFFSLLQLVLVYRWNRQFGMPDTVFALGDNTFMQFASALQMMPACIMFVVLCPEGSEGTTYALLTTVLNLSQTVASNIGTYLTSVWDTSNASISAGNYTGVAHLTVLTSVLHLLPILFISLLPASKEEQLALREKGESSVRNGGVLVTVVAMSLVFTVSMNLYVIFRD